MSPLPAINQFAVVLRPTAAFFDWANACPPGCPANLTLQDIRREATVYLNPESEGEPGEYLERYAMKMLSEELGGWYLHQT